MDIQKIPASRLNVAAYNPRKDLKPGDREYEKLKRSISEFGYVEPVIWNRQTGNVVGGHQRLKVLVDLGQREIDCVVVNLDLQQEKALNIALNKIQGDWDEGKLASLMAEFDASAFDVSLTGFDAEEVDALLNKFYSHEATEDDFDAEGEKKKIADAGGPITQPGDCWRLGDHLLLCGDAADLAAYEKLLGNEQAQCAVTSPPADPKEYAKDGLEPWLKRMAEVIRLLAHYAGIICWQTADLMKTGSPFIEPLSFHSNRLFADENFRPLWIRVWKMTGSVPATALQPPPKPAAVHASTERLQPEAPPHQHQRLYRRELRPWARVLRGVYPSPWAQASSGTVSGRAAGGSHTGLRGQAAVWRIRPAEFPEGRRQTWPAVRSTNPRNSCCPPRITTRSAPITPSISFNP